ncbi:MAG: DUF1549 domain-containing protein [Planctomycetota bacterium]|nr:DUF1549 domain-containing protein [Planctomycetota bacterium]
MSDNRYEFDDPIFDIMLEELLGDTAPRDMSAEILSKLHNSEVEITSPFSVIPHRQNKRTALWGPLSFALSTAACVLAVIAIITTSDPPLSQNGSNDFVAQVNAPKKPAVNNTTESLLAKNLPPSEKDAKPEKTLDQPMQMLIADGNEPLAPRTADAESKAKPSGWKHPLAFVSTETISPIIEKEILSGITRELSKQWKEQGVTPSTFATDLEWVRRVYLRLIGRVPTTNELSPFFEGNSSPEKREGLVNRLLFSSQYSEEYLQHWTNLWINTLIGRHGGTGKDKANRKGLAKYIYDSLQANKPYNQIVRELIAATGDSHADSEQFNGAVNFLLASVNADDTTLATARTTSIFLGQKLQCAQCHNHPSSDIAQNQFWEMDAYFSQIHIAPVDKNSENGYTLSSKDFQGVKTPEGDAGNYFEQSNGVTRLVFPAFLGHAETSASGAVDDFDRRSRLASLISNSPLLERTLVNRMWNHFFGYGFTPEIDDMSPHVQVSHPQLLESLANQTRASKYNLKSLLKWLALSDPFLRSSVYSPSNEIDSPELGDQPLFSRYYSRQLEPEEVYQSLRALSGEIRTPDSFGQQQLAQRDWLGQFTHRMDTDEAEEVSSFKGDIQQSLILMNGELMKKATSLEENTVLGEIVANTNPTQVKVQQLFMAALARHPSEQELAKIKQLSVQAQAGEQQFLQDIWWALLNSSEYILDH